MALGNWYICWHALVKQQRTSSWTPLVGGIMGVAGMEILPIRGVASFSWLPLILDWGCLPGLLYTAWYYIFRRDRL